MNAQQERVNAMVARLEQLQATLGLPDTRFVARYQRHLGSAKTWRDRLCARNWDELAGSLDKWESNLRALVAEIDGAADLAGFNPSMPMAKYAALMYQKLQGQTNDRRCVLLIGDYGTGKSMALRSIHREFPGETAYFECTPAARGLGHIVGMIARSLGVAELNSPAKTLDAIIDALRANPVTLLVDEGHESGVYLLKVLKTIINQTRARVMIGTYPTGWQKLVSSSTEAYSEARQLLGRTIKPIEVGWEKGCREADVKKYLEGAGWNGESAAIARKVHGLVRGNGNLRTLADGLDKASELAEAGEVTAEHVVRGVEIVCGKVVA